jgi:hypothetical protein
MPDPVEPASPAPASPGRPLRTWPDTLLAILVLAFAFLAASFTARNSDLWRHLAAGRLLADGGSTFGIDPFAYTTEHVYWADHAWLAELVLYQAHEAVGGGGLVALKALIVVLTVGFMLGSARGAGPFWVTAGVTLLAMLAMSSRLQLQPACESLLLLALCLWLFRCGGRAHVALPLVIAAWVNLDDWYVLGPLLVGMCCVGRWVRPTDDVPRPPVWLLPACLIACLVSPFHVRGLTLPTEISPAVWASGFPDDPRFAGLFASPWRLGPLGPAGGYNLAAWAFWVLLGLGLVSFAVNRRAALGWRSLAWLGFALLACWQTRFIPFFAVVAGPVTALNLRELFPNGFLVRPGRVFAGVVALVLIALTWPGWLQGFTARDRGLAWAAIPDPGLERAAQAVRQWRADGTLPSSVRTLATHPDLAHHLVWFCPGERVFFDGRLGLFTDMAFQTSGPVPSRPDATTVLLYDPEPRRMAAVLRAVATDLAWELIAVEGGVVVVRPRSESTGVRFSAARQAFGPVEGVSPETGVALAAEAPPVWERRNRPRRVSGDGDTAVVYLRLFEVEPAPADGPPAKSPALPVLAARSARAAVAAGPGDDAAWLTLAQATLFQSRATWEAQVGRPCPLLVHLRQAQIAAALVQAVIAHPNGAGGHEALAGLYGERGFLDLAVRHRREHHRLVRQAGPGPGEAPAAFADRLDRLTAGLIEAENALQDAENWFLIKTHGRAGDPLGRAQTAAGLGLTGRALEILTTSHADLYGIEGLRLLLELLTWAGQAADVRALLDRDELRRNPDALGNYVIPGGVQDGRPWSYAVHTYDWYDLLQSAAAGRYGAAVGAADRLRARLRAQEGGSRRMLAPQAAHQLVSQAGMVAGPGAAWHLPFAVRNRAGLLDVFAIVNLAAAARADLHVIEGLLHLERGTTGAAGQQFATAVRVYTTDAAAGRIHPGRPLAERYLAELQNAGR